MADRPYANMYVPNGSRPAHRIQDRSRLQPARPAPQPQRPPVVPGTIDGFVPTQPVALQQPVVAPQQTVETVTYTQAPPATQPEPVPIDRPTSFSQISAVMPLTPAPLQPPQAAIEQAAAPASPPLNVASRARQYIHMMPQMSALNLTRSNLPKPNLIKNPPGKQLVLGVLAFAVFGVGLAGNLQAVQNNKHAKAEVAALAKQAQAGSTADKSDTGPSEAKSSAKVAAYNVAPTAPKSIKITRLAIDVQIESLGITSESGVQMPSNIHNAGWYNASAQPGDGGANGAILINGYAKGPTQPGVFVNTSKIQIGDVIQIVRGDGQNFSYKVVQVDAYSAKLPELSKLLISIQPRTAGLNIVTTSYTQGSQSSDYTVVYATQI